MKFTMQNNLKFNNEEIFLRKQIRKIISEVYVDSSLGTAEDTYNPIRTSLVNFNELIYRLGKKFGFDHEMLKEILWEIRMEISPAKLEGEIIEILKKYGVYKDFGHLIYMNENDGVDELYPMLVGEEDLEEGWKDTAKKTFATAALGTALAGAPMKSSAQTKVQNFAKDKISMVQDKVQDIKGDVKDFTKDQITGAKEKIGNFINKKKIREKEEAEIKTLRNNLNVVEKMEGNRFKVTVEQKYRRPGDVSFAESNAIQNAKILILNKMGGERYQFERAVKHLEKYVENNDGTYSYFLIVSFEVE